MHGHACLAGDVSCGLVPVRSLTLRERTVLEHLSTGLTANAIARRMDISPGTVNKHLGSTYRKLGVCDRLAATLTAQRLGLISEVPPVRQNG